MFPDKEKRTHTHTHHTLVVIVAISYVVCYCRIRCINELFVFRPIISTYFSIALDSQDVVVFEAWMLTERKFTAFHFIWWERKLRCTTCTTCLLVKTRLTLILKCLHRIQHFGIMYFICDGESVCAAITCCFLGEATA